MGEKVALDSAVFIYYLEEHPRYGPRALQLMEKVEVGEIEGVTSSLCAVEVLVRPFALGDMAVVDQYRSLFTEFPHLATRPVDEEVSLLAAELRAKERLRLADAVVGATALVEGCSRLLTNDRKLRVLSERGIRVELIGRFET